MSKIALVTGACSGIGLALTLHLLSNGWSVVLADIQSPQEDQDLPSERTLFVKTNVASYEDQAHLFSEAFKWHGRLDFAALNAGIDDRDDIFASIDTSSPPKKPNMSTFEVDLLGVYYGIKLFAHYASKNPVPGGKIVVTASVAGFYPNPGIPQYVSAKHGVIGLVRSLAPVAALHNITINALAPAFVATNLDTNLLKWFPKESITPMSMMIRAFDQLMDPTLNHNGETVEGCVEGLYYREPLEPLSPSMKNLVNTDGMRLWVESYIKKNAEIVRRSHDITK